MHLQLASKATEAGARQGQRRRAGQLVGTNPMAILPQALSV